MDRAFAESWIRAHVEPAGPIVVERARPWSTVLRVPIRGGVAWFKACAPVQAFEPRLATRLFARWPDRVAEVIAHDEERAWLLLADAGTSLRDVGNAPERWADALPRYAEVQRGESAYAEDHLAHGVPDLRVTELPARFEELVGRHLPLDDAEIARLSAFAVPFAGLCAELESRGVAPSLQHDDLHTGNVYERDRRLRFLDWGDASIGHPFTSLVVTFRFLEELNGLTPDDRWFTRLRDAYLEPWGPGHDETFALALRIGAFAHAIAWSRQRDHLREADRAAFDEVFAVVLRRAVVRTGG